MRKLKLLFFPYSHSNWSVFYDQDQEAQPNHEVNAPDLYIPFMAIVTYFLVAGLCLGVQGKFSLDVLGMQARSTLMWLVLESLVFLATIYVTGIQTNLKYLDILAFSSYKYVGMSVVLLAGVIMKNIGYYCLLIYSSFSLVIFLFHTLAPRLRGSDSRMDTYTTDIRRRLCLLLFISGLQPFIMWWFTQHLIPSVIIKA